MNIGHDEEGETRHGGGWVYGMLGCHYFRGMTVVCMANVQCEASPFGVRAMVTTRLLALAHCSSRIEKAAVMKLLGFD